MISLLRRRSKRGSLAGQVAGSTPGVQYTRDRGGVIFVHPRRRVHKSVVFGVLDLTILHVHFRILDPPIP